MIKRIGYDVPEDRIVVDLLEMILASQQLEPRKCSMEIEKAIAFRVSEEGHLTHYWSARDSEEVDPATTIYTIRSSEYLDEVTENYLWLEDRNPLIHFLMPGPDACLEFIADRDTRITIRWD